jgi:hypothetical protein
LKHCMSKHCILKQIVWIFLKNKNLFGRPMIAHRIWFCCQKMCTYISREGQNAHSGNKWGNSHISDITKVSNFWLVLKVYFVKKIKKFCVKCSQNAHLTSNLKTHTLHLEKCAQNMLAVSKVSSLGRHCGQVRS